ncbi:radical SAM protein [bacterium]|nr:radical SAM protein [bacterium]
MKIVLILPIGSIHRFGTGNFGKSLRYAPLTLTTLAALIPDDLDADIKIYDESVEEVNYETLEADIVGISAITGTSLRAYKIADTLRNKGITVVIGGVHATLLPKEAKEHADSVVTGMAEFTWPRLLRDFKYNYLKPFYHQGPELILEGFPMARRDLLKKDGYVTHRTIQATRGCPNICDFCVIPSTWGTSYYTRPVKEIIEELEQFDDGPIVFLDPSPIEDIKYSKELYKAMIPLKKKWVGLSTIRMAYDKELLSLAAQSGCKGLLIGFESVSQNTLAIMYKDFNNTQNYREMITRFHDSGIAIQGCFVFGFDTDDIDVFKRTVDFVYETNIDLPRYAVYTPFPNTPAYIRLDAEERIIDRNWSLYDVEHVVFQPKKMSVQQLEKGLIWAWKASYTASSISKRLLFSGLFNSLFYMKNLPLLNMGYRNYAYTLHKYTNDVLKSQT